MGVAAVVTGRATATLFAGDTLKERPYCDVLRPARDSGGDFLYDALRELGLTGRLRKASKIQRIGYGYATAGVVLRYCQTELVADERFEAL